MSWELFPTAPPKGSHPTKGRYLIQYRSTNGWFATSRPEEMRVTGWEAVRIARADLRRSGFHVVGTRRLWMGWL
jgi:hypothetical protein